MNKKDRIAHIISSNLSQKTSWHECCLISNKIIESEKEFQSPDIYDVIYKAHRMISEFENELYSELKKEFDRKDNNDNLPNK